jgi:hypothetical protein
MGVLDEYKLYYEKLPSETKKLLLNPLIRERAYRLYRYSLKVADSAEDHISRWRLFRRLGHIEDKVDKPFLYDSGLLERIELLEKYVDKQIVRKPRKAKAAR